MVFTIKKGQHYNFGLWHLFPFCFSKNLFFTFKLSKECLFELKEADDYDVNKIFGRSFGLDHHKDSVRIGWIPSTHDGKYSLYLYWYNAGERDMKKICELDAEKEYAMRLDFFLDICCYEVFKETDVYSIHFVLPKRTFGQYLFPYFGGNKTAPHDMKIKIELNK